MFVLLPDTIESSPMLIFIVGCFAFPFCASQIFYEDSLKFFTSLYGHKLPVLTMDISQDSTILVTGSADKNIKFWGLDFGDCHRSIFAHSDSIMNVMFVAHTHYVFTVSKDRTVKYWDGDTFEHIATLEGHQAEVRYTVGSRLFMYTKLSALLVNVCEPPYHVFVHMSYVGLVWCCYK